MNHRDDADYWDLTPGPERAAFYGRLSAFHRRRAAYYGARAERFGRAAGRLRWLALALLVLSIVGDA